MHPMSKVWVFLLVICMPGIAMDRDADIVGSALDPGSGSLLYREYHFCTEDGMGCLVIYRDDMGLEIARKQVDYRTGRRSPTISMRDSRTQKVVVVKPDPESVVDAGFDNFVRESWNLLERDGTLEFPFLVPGRDRPLNMQARTINGEACDGNVLCLQVRPRSWPLGLLVEPILLTYDRENRRLLRYQGVSNIRDAGGNMQKVDIHYRYNAPAAG